MHDTIVPKPLKALLEVPRTGTRPDNTVHELLVLSRELPGKRPPHQAQTLQDACWNMLAKVAIIVTEHLQLQTTAFRHVSIPSERIDDLRHSTNHKILLKALPQQVI